MKKGFKEKIGNTGRRLKEGGERLKNILKLIDGWVWKSCFNK